MNILVDANVFKGYVMEEILDLDHGLTDSPMDIFTNDNIVICFDEKDQIKTEYTNLVKQSLAEEIIIDMLNRGKIRLTKHIIDQGLEHALKSKGFDFNSRDKWYIRVALYAKNTNASRRIYIVSEDIDFYNPQKKECCSEERFILIRDKNSPLSKYLINQAKICPVCVETYNNSIA